MLHCQDKWRAETDFDDGGTRAWRANQATWGRVIDVQQPGIRGWFRRASLPKLFCVAFFGVTGICGAVGIGGLLLAYRLIP